MPCSPHWVAPHDVSPASTRKPPSLTISGPPESPPQVSVVPPPAHTIESAWKFVPQTAAQPMSETIPTLASSSRFDVPPSSVTPQPITVARRPAAHSGVSPSSISRSGSRFAGAVRSSVSTATSLANASAS